MGGYTFPTRYDYLACCGSSRTVDDLDADTIIAIQRDWHMRGQNGCVFAMHAARKLNNQQWRYETYPRVPDASAIRQSITNAIADPENQILSLVFPAVECEKDVRDLVSLARSAGCYEAVEVEECSDFVSLRYPIHDAESWIVGFAPLATLPPTRRAPFAELAIRTKAKSKVNAVHPELNGETTQAHLADVDLSFDPKVVTNLISKSKARSAKILGGESIRNATKGAKARVTYGLSIK
ncbi:MAG: hypothetical protein ACRDSP_05120 [Pseudonocardiaceae bacterium]